MVLVSAIDLRREHGRVCGLRHLGARLRRHRQLEAPLRRHGVEAALEVAVERQRADALEGAAARLDPHQLEIPGRKRLERDFGQVIPQILV